MGATRRKRWALRVESDGRYASKAVCAQGRKRCALIKLTHYRILYRDDNMETIKVAPIKPTVSIDLLEKIDIRVGTITLIEDVAGSTKLFRMTVDFGNHTRTILVGMKQERDNPKQLEGTQTLFVINLEPKRIMGEVSEGMLLDIGYADGIKPVLALPEVEVPNGARVG
jgi:methionine--tRNA ligase beta chain